MLNKNTYAEGFTSLQDIASHYGDNQDLQADVRNALHARDRFDIKVIVVGHFNAGKSSLLNGLLGRQGFLAEAQLPQTSIAAELHYAEVEASYAYTVHGDVEPFSANKSYLPDAYNHIAFYLPSNGLRQVSDFTLVDTPGFDSGIENHEKALALYSGCGSVYLLVIDVERGCLDEVSLSKLKSISKECNRVAVLFNKCDKVTAEDAERVVSLARRTLELNRLPYSVYTISKHDENVADKLVSVITAFDAQSIYDEEMRRELYSAAQALCSVLKSARSKLYLDTYDFDVEIHNMERAKKSLFAKLEAKRASWEDGLVQETEETMSRLQAALQSRASQVSEVMVMGNSAGVQAIISETVRHTLTASMRDLTGNMMSDLVCALDFSDFSHSEADSVDWSSMLQDFYARLKDTLEEGAFESDTTEKRAGKREAVHKGVTTVLAVVTDFIAPWLEAIIIFLPDIVKLCKSLFGETKQEQAKRQFEAAVIPQITDKLHPQVQEAVHANAQTLLENTQAWLEEKVAAVNQTLSGAQEKKAASVAAYEQYLAQLAQDIEQLEFIMQSVGGTKDE